MTNTTAIGRAAEAAAASYLEANGHIILDRNWRNRWCEIDLVTRNIDIVHFIEAKYRANTEYGFGFEYIGRDKTSRLLRAAAAWCQAHGYQGDYQIDVISATGSLSHPEIEYIPNAISSF